MGTRKDIIQKFNGEIVKALTSPELKSRLSKDSADVMASTPDEFRDYIASETVKWAWVIRKAGHRCRMRGCGE